MTRRTVTDAVPNILTLLCIALLPIQTRWILHAGALAGGTWEYGTLSLYATDIVLVLAFLTTWIARGPAFWKKPAHVPSAITAATLAVLAVITFSIFIARDVGVGLSHWLFFLEGLMLWWLIVQSSVSLAWCAIAFLASAGAESAIGLLQVTTQSIHANTFLGMAAQTPSAAGTAVIETSAGRFLRAYGTFPHPNIAAGWMVIACLLAAGMYVRAKDWAERIALFALAMLLEAGLFVTFSRAGIITFWTLLLVMLFSALWRDRKQHRARFPWSLFHIPHTRHLVSPRLVRFTLVSFLLTGALAMAFSPLVSVRTKLVERLEVKSMQERKAQFADARNLFVQNLFLGTGIGNYTNVLHDNVDANRSVWGYQPVHLTLLLALIELGILGWVVLIWAIELVGMISFQRHVAEWKHMQPRLIPWTAITGTILLALLLLSFFEHYFWSLHIGVLVAWLAFGMWTKSLAMREES